MKAVGIVGDHVLLCITHQMSPTTVLQNACVTVSTNFECPSGSGNYCSAGVYSFIQTVHEQVSLEQT
jgi:hypothetical protein